MSESADYWNRMMRANDMDCDAALAAIQGEYDEEDCECLGCGEWITPEEKVCEVTCLWCAEED